MKEIVSNWADANGVELLWPEQSWRSISSNRRSSYLHYEASEVFKISPPSDFAFLKPIRMKKKEWLLPPASNSTLR